MNTGGDVTVQVRADVAGLLSGMKEASGATRAATEEMSSHMAGMKSGAHEAAGGVDHLVEHLRGMRSEMRLGNFMALQIASMGIASKSAAGEVTQLAAAFALGGPMGVGIEAVKILVSTFNELGKEEQKAAAEIKKYFTDATTAVVGVRDEVNKLLLSMSGAGQAETMFLTKIIPLTKEQADIKQELIKAETALAKARESAKFSVESEKELEQATRNEAEAVERVKEKLEAKTKQIEAEAEEVKRLKEAEADQKETNTKNDELVAEQQFNLEMMKLRTALTDGQTKLQLEFYEKSQALRDKYVGDEAKADAQIELLQQKLFMDLAQLRESDNVKQLEAAQKRADEIRALNVKAAQDTINLEKEIADHEQKETEKRIADAKRMAKEVLGHVETMSKTMSSAFAGMIDGTESVGKAFKKMAGEAVKIILDLAIKSIMASAEKAAAEAAAANAGIPIVGPAIAIAAAGSMAGFVLGLIGSLPSAAGGYDIPSGVNPVVQTHENEMILPAPIADGFRQMFAGGGGAGSVVFNINAVDGLSVQRMIESRDFQRSFAEARRNGLL